MKKTKWLLLILSVCLAGWLGAEVNILSVTSEDVHTQKKDFWHTFEYYIVASNGKTTKCQATRVAKNWFATAAHCVAVPCAESCKLRMDLLEQPVSAFVDGKHTSKKPIVFVHPAYKVNASIAQDFALIHMNLSLLPAHYYRRPTGERKLNQLISRKEFEAFLKEHPQAQKELARAMRPQLPPILVFDNSTQRIDRTLSVVSIFEGVRDILHNPYPTDYVKEIGFAYTQNFGVRNGMSGSGVMTNTGELAGIISASVFATHRTKPGKEYFAFAAFNPDLVNFMQEVMGGDYDQIDFKDAVPNYVTRSPANHSEIIRAATNIST